MVILICSRTNFLVEVKNEMGMQLHKDFFVVKN